MAKRVPRRQAQRILSAREAMQDRLAVGMAREVTAHQRMQAARAARLQGRKAFTDPLGLVPDSDVQLLNRVLRKYEGAQWEFTSGTVAPLVGVDPSDVISPKAQRAMLSRAKGITDATRTRIVSLVKRGVAQQRTDAQIGQLIGEAIGNPARGKMIARTEMALIDQASATDRYRAGGVKTVEVFDGAGCGWSTHDDGDKANGSIRTLRQAEAMPLAHPNCRRAFMPVTDVTVPDTSEELAAWQRAQQAQWRREGLIA